MLSGVRLRRGQAVDEHDIASLQTLKSVRITLNFSIFGPNFDNF